MYREHTENVREGMVQTRKHCKWLEIRSSIKLLLSLSLFSESMSLLFLRQNCPLFLLLSPADSAVQSESTRANLITVSFCPRKKEIGGNSFLVLQPNNCSFPYCLSNKITLLLFLFCCP